jgi:replicative DNA helicase
VSEHEHEQDAPPPEDRSPGRTPPQDLAAEQALLGAMLIDPNAIDEVMGSVYGTDFYRPAHEVVFDAISDLYGRGEPVDMVTVSNLLTQQGLIGKVGGPVYLHDLTSMVPIAANAAHYAAIVAEKAMLRRLVEAGTKIVQRGYAQEGDVAEVYDHSMADLLAVGGPRRGEDYVLINDLMPPILDEMEDDSPQLSGVPTGFYDLDELTNGLHPGQMIVVAGRPAMGKSTLAVDFARSAAIRHQMPTVIFSLEMDRNELVKRVISAESRVALNKIRDGLLSEQDWQRIAQHSGSIMEAPLFIDDSPNLTMTEIAAKARRLKAKHGLRLLVIDYLQLMSSGRRVENRQVEVSEFSRQIKVLAKELQVPAVVLSQLNRGVEQRSTKRPMLSDLRESGAIEQDADVVVLLHRDDMYEAESSRPGEADLIVAKHRNGATRDVTVVAQLHYSRFVDMAS